MVAVERGERRRGERLRPETDARHPQSAGRGHELRHHVGRIGLERHLGARDGDHAALETAPQALEARGAEMRGGAAADVQRVDGEGTVEPVEFAVEGAEVTVGEVVAAGEDGEVAVAATVPAEGDVDVGRARRGHSHTWSRPSSMSGIRLARIRRMRSSV